MKNLLPTKPALPDPDLIVTDLKQCITNLHLELQKPRDKIKKVFVQLNCYRVAAACDQLRELKRTVPDDVMIAIPADMRHAFMVNLAAYCSRIVQ